MESIQRIFELISIFPSSEKVQPKTKLRNHLFGISLFCIALTCIGPSAAFFITFVQIDLENALYALSQILGLGCAAYTIAVGYQQRHSITEILIEFQSIRNKYPSKFIDEANRRGESITKFAMNYVIAGFILNSIALAGISLIKCLIDFGHVDFDHLFYTHKLILPWNRRTLFGWIAETAFSIIFGCTCLIINGVFVSFFITICEYLRAFHGHFRTTIEQLDGTPPNNVKLLLKRTIHFHIRTKQLFQRTTDVYSVLMLIQLICSMLLLSVCMFQMDLAITHLDIKVFIMIIGAIVSGLNLFLYCYFGHIATDSFLRMADSSFESKWYNQPLRLQKYFRIMIQNAQQPIRFHGFGVAYLDLNTYCKILRMVVSYYMMFKTLTSKP